MATVTDTTAVQESIPAGTWRIDPIHSSIGFEVKHFGVSTFRGRFTDYDGAIDAGEGGITSVRGAIRTESVDVKDEQLGGHLRSTDFFDVERHPEARFESTAVEGTGGGAYKVRGDFTLRGVTRPIELDVRVDGLGIGPDGNERVSLVGEGALDRTEYGLDWNSTLPNGALMVGERVRLVLAVEAVHEEA